MKKLLLVVAALAIATVSYAQEFRRIYSVSTTVSATNTAYSDTIPLKIASSTGLNSIGVMYKGTSTPTDIKIYFQQGYDYPTTEGAADPNLMDTDLVATATTNGWLMATIDTVTFPFGRFKFIGQGSNASGNIIELRIATE